MNVRVCGGEGVSHHVPDRDHPQDEDDDSTLNPKSRVRECESVRVSECVSVSL